MDDWACFHIAPYRHIAWKNDNDERKRFGKNKNGWHALRSAAFQSRKACKVCVCVLHSRHNNTLKRLFMLMEMDCSMAAAGFNRRIFFYFPPVCTAKGCGRRSIMKQVIPNKKILFK